MKKSASKITDLLALTVFAVFAVCILTVLLYGARGYRRMVQRGDESFRLRTCTQYVRTRVRQAQQLQTEDFEGCDALTIREEIDGSVYLTRIYCYEGYLRELYTPESGEFSPADGEKLFPLTDLTFQDSEDFLRITVTLDQPHTLTFHKPGEVLP